jgi:hypothetical protein
MKCWTPLVWNAISFFYNTTKLSSEILLTKHSNEMLPALSSFSTFYNCTWNAAHPFIGLLYVMPGQPFLPPLLSVPTHSNRMVCCPSFPILSKLYLPHFSTPSVCMKILSKLTYSLKLYGMLSVPTLSNYM